MGVADGEIAGNRPAAFPAPMSELDTLFRLGMGPIGRAVSGRALAADVVGEADAEVTVTVAAAAGGVHLAVVAMLAVAVSFTELTEVALDETGTWASMSTVLESATEPMVQVAVLSLLAQPLVNVAF